MAGSLAIHRGRPFWGPRGVAVAAIAVLHAGLLALALQQRLQIPAPAPSRVSISLFAPEPTQAAAAPQMPAPRLDSPTLALLLPPEPAWEVTESATTSAPTVALEPVVAESAPRAAEPRASAPLEISRAEYLRAPAPRYPPVALAARREGSVGLRVLVGADGRVIDVVVERPSGFAPFDEAACNAVRTALFRPYTVNGEPQVGAGHRTHRFLADDPHGQPLELDVGGQDDHALGGHAEEFRGLRAAALHVGEQRAT